MSRWMQCLSLAGGILILGYGILRLFEPQPEWMPMILGGMIVVFSVSRMLRGRAGKRESDGKRL